MRDKLIIFLVMISLPFLIAARDFNGTTDRIDYTTVLTPATDSPFTLSLWVNNDTGTATTKYLFNINDDTGTRSWTFLLSNSPGAGAVQFQRIFSTTNHQVRITSGTLGTGTWTHFVIKGSGSATASTTTIWKNGSQLTPDFSSSGVGTEKTHSGTWSIGGRTSDDAVNADARFAYMGYWNREISTAEVVMLSKGYAPNCIPYGLKWAPTLTREQLDPTTGQSGTLDGTTVAVNPSIIECK